MASAANRSGQRLRQQSRAARQLNRRRTVIRTKQKGIAPRNSLEKRNSDAQLLAAVKNFETAVRYFQKQNYNKAKEILEKLVSIAPPEVADRARVHLRLCLQRLDQATAAPKTAGEYHVLGVAELNARNLDLAVEHLSKAYKLQPKQEEIRYALAAAHALQGNADAALEHLKAAIELRPQDRFQARHDEDFQSLTGDPRFKSLVLGEDSRTSRVTS